MSTLAKKHESDFTAISIDFSDDMICLGLEDGREIKTPIEFYPRLAHATKKQLKNFKWIGGGTGIHWPDIDEDLSVESIVLGRKAYNSPAKGKSVSK